MFTILYVTLIIAKHYSYFISSRRTSVATLYTPIKCNIIVINKTTTTTTTIIIALAS